MQGDDVPLHPLSKGDSLRGREMPEGQRVRRVSVHPLETQFSYFPVPEGTGKYEESSKSVTSWQEVHENKFSCIIQRSKN